MPPVSPIVWVHTDTELTKPAQLYISHHVLIENDEDRRNVCLLTRGDNQKMFRINKHLGFETHKTFVKVSFYHLCHVCVANKEVLRKRYNFVLAKKKLESSYVCDVCIFYCQKDLEVCHKFTDSIILLLAIC